MVEFSVRRHCLTPYNLQKLRQTVNYFRKNDYLCYGKQVLWVL